MDHEKKSQKLLAVAIVPAVIRLATAAAFGAVLAAFNGSAVTVNDIASGTVTNSTDGGTTWNANPSAISKNHEPERKIEHDKLPAHVPISEDNYSLSSNSNVVPILLKESGGNDIAD